jgi:hypothetical protein
MSITKLPVSLLRYLVAALQPQCKSFCKLVWRVHFTIERREELDRLYPANVMIRTTKLHTAAEVLTMAQYVKVAKIGEDVFAERATGIPPHVIHTCLLEELKTKIDTLFLSFALNLKSNLIDTPSMA